MVSISINIQPNTGVCEGFLDGSGELKRRSIVLAPVKVRVEGGSFTLNWTCNLAEQCYNKECFYAKAKTSSSLQSSL
ncbi:hypothetical protein KEJ27_01595 [Candidatus Bathyarchaeota archaeon]|nr:hypothetical protein [Candidatus Bathyarchaeota archaeon]MBS7613272.1 hypothetical protein [Candidatus Bathyarchaeota archaeon]MBS7617653.1 hypothetical protein [Candidatus Bathyarchaeota archaeon]